MNDDRAPRWLVRWLMTLVLFLSSSCYRLRHLLGGDLPGSNGSAPPATQL